MSNNKGLVGLRPKSEVTRREDDAYFTPIWCTTALLNSGILDLNDKRVLEPCAGNGAIVDVLRSHGVDCTGRDKNDWDRGWAGHDFRDGMNGFDAIITNPPFNMMDHFLADVISAAPVVAVLGRTLIVEGKRRRNSIWKIRPPSHILQLPHRVDFVSGGDGKGGVLACAWYIWDGKSAGTQFVWCNE